MVNWTNSYGWIRYFLLFTAFLAIKYIAFLAILGFFVLASFVIVHKFSVLHILFWNISILRASRSVPIPAKSPSIKINAWPFGKRWPLLSANALILSHRTETSKIYAKLVIIPVIHWRVVGSEYSPTRLDFHHKPPVKEQIYPFTTQIYLFQSSFFFSSNWFILSFLWALPDQDAFNSFRQILLRLFLFI